MAARTVYQFCIFDLVRRADFDSAVCQHFGEADDRVQRRAKLVTYGGDEAASVRTRPLEFKPGRFKHVFVRLSLTDIAEDRNDILVCLFMSGRYAFERLAPHFDPNELAGASGSNISLYEIQASERYPNAPHQQV